MEIVLSYLILSYIRYYCCLQILLSPAIEVEDGDKIGFTSTSGHVPVTYTDGSPDETGSNISFLPWPSENDTVPEVGEVYTFSDGFSTYIFAIAVDVDTGKRVLIGHNFTEDMSELKYGYI